MILQVTCSAVVRSSVLSPDRSAPSVSVSRASCIVGLVPRPTSLSLHLCGVCCLSVVPSHWYPLFYGCRRVVMLPFGQRPVLRPAAWPVGAGIRADNREPAGATCRRPARRPAGHHLPLPSPGCSAAAGPGWARVGCFTGQEAACHGGPVTAIGRWLASHADPCRLGPSQTAAGHSGDCGLCCSVATPLSPKCEAGHATLTAAAAFGTERRTRRRADCA